MPEPAPRRTLRLLDLAALVVGFGLAALLMRAFWPASRTPTMAVGLVSALEYLWLGLTMSGPVVLLFDRRAAPDRDPGGPPGAEAPPRYTRAELAWLSIGVFLIVMTFVIAPARLPNHFLPIAGLTQALAALALVLFGPSRPPHVAGPSWTHHVAVGLLATWPLAWAALILLSMT